jgi:hypothetical protein
MTAEARDGAFAPPPTADVNRLTGGSTHTTSGGQR